jgi:hypothetical protein
VNEIRNKIAADLLAEIAADLLAACVLLRRNGFSFHPGPPEGPEFEGLARLCYAEQTRAGSSTDAVFHRPTRKGIHLTNLFTAAREAVSPRVSILDIFVHKAERDNWFLVGPGVPAEFAEA